ncbi:MAG: hypothetical protein IGR80_18050 [Synechococcales cyanobacterium K44_A2020_017]|nr:hypothetical protein [Synechococcales cyanobacterium K32_A2020_035]MBF2096642.1 hypothetical protein [Synechococcales cyanobacterium K44_A2020_017]
MVDNKGNKQWVWLALDADTREIIGCHNEGKIVAIDIETGDFEVDENLVTATNRLFERHPDAQPWVIRIGHRAVDHLGWAVPRHLHRRIRNRPSAWNDNALRLSVAG